VRIARPGRDFEMLKQCVADEMRRLAARFADAEVDARLTEANRAQLRVAVGDVQECDVAERLQRAVKTLAIGIVGGSRRVDAQARNGGGRDRVQELAAPHRSGPSLNDACRQPNARGDCAAQSATHVTD